MKIHSLKSLKDTERVAEEFAAQLGPRDLILLNGEMGTGKTTFVRAISQAVGLNSAASPSFAVHQRYENQKHILDHVDLYRVESEEDLETTGFWELFDQKKSWIFVEWAERLDVKWPSGWRVWNLYFSGDGDQRRLQISHNRQADS